MVKPSGLPIMSATVQTDRHQGRYSYPGPPLYSLRLIAHCGPAHLEATAIRVAMAGKPVNILAAYLSPSRPMIGADISACFGGEIPVLMAGDLNAKHVDWNSRLSTRRGNPCVIMPTGTSV